MNHPYRCESKPPPMPKPKPPKELFESTLFDRFLAVLLVVWLSIGALWMLAGLVFTVFILAGLT